METKLLEVKGFQEGDCAGFDLLDNLLSFWEFFMRGKLISKFVLKRTYTLIIMLKEGDKIALNI